MKGQHFYIYNTIIMCGRRTVDQNHISTFIIVYSCYYYRIVVK